MKKYNFFILLTSLLLSSCQTSQDKKYEYIDSSKGKAIICTQQDDSIQLSKRAYTDSNKTSKQLGLYPKIRSNACQVVNIHEITVIPYSPQIEFRLSDDGLDTYYSPIHELKKVKYKDNYYWLVR